MAELPTRVYQTIREARAKMHYAQNSHRQLRQQVDNLCIDLANTAYLQLMPLVQKSVDVYPVMKANGLGGFLNLFPQELCFLGVDVDGRGWVTGADISFADFLIYFCDYNVSFINYIFQRAKAGDPVTFDEALEIDMSSNIINQNVYQGQIINASGNANVHASTNISEIIPPQYQAEYTALVSYLKSTDEASSKNTKISNFIQKLTEAGFGAIVGQIAQYLFSLV